MASAFKCIAMFPGQGSQYVGMGRVLLSEFPGLRPLFEEAEDAAKLNIRKLCLDGPDDELRLTANTQPCILTVSVAMWRMLVNETGVTPALFAGHSLGEYSAIVAAGKIPFSRAVALVCRRGEVMQEAMPAGLGAMLAVLNTPAEALEALCKAESRKDSLVEVANYNSPQQLVVGGHRTAIDRLCKGLDADQIRYVMLPVSAAFHTSLMAPAREVMAPLLRDCFFAKTTTKIIPNLTGTVAWEYEAEFLIEQITSPVRWSQTMTSANQDGCDLYLEVGPGKVLAGLTRRCLSKDTKVLGTDDLKQAIKSIQALN